MKKINYYEIANRKLKYLAYSPNTIKVYLWYINEFLNNIEKEPSRLNSSDFKNYLESYKFKSVSQQNQVINSIRFLYVSVLDKKYEKVKFDRPRKEKRLPKIIDKNLILSSLGKIENLKHKAILTIAYSVGLRVSEVIGLKIEDIDSGRMVIDIIQSKGNKDRSVPLSENVLSLLRLYFKKFRPKTYLFNGQTGLRYSATSCNKLVKKYVGKEYHFHLLRHSCFTNLTEQGVDLRVIQKLAGHSSSKTTEIYTQVSNHILGKIPLAI
tara:strand:+ start:58 stop:858 length:801 start_codon:yes stop_codon:yes gene_type:complete